MSRNDDRDRQRTPPGSGAGEGVASGEVKERLFAIGESAGAAPLAAVFKTRRRSPRRQSTPPPTPERNLTGGSREDERYPLASDPPLDVLDVLEGDALEIDERSPDESFDVLLTDDFRVAPGSTPPATSPAPPRLEDLIPPDADPVWAREAILGIAEQNAGRHRPTEGAWYQELFSQDYIRSEPPTTGEQLRTEVDFIESALSVPSGGRMLDLGCGYGRHTVPLARRGYEMVGLDLSLDLLQNALRRAQAKQASIKFVHGDLRDLEFDQVFDGAFCFNTTFGYFTEAQNLIVLRGVYRALKPGGRFLIDVANRDHAIQSIPARNWWEGDGCLIQEDVDFDHLTSRLMTKRFLVYADGTQREYDIALRLFSAHEVLAMLRLVGFRFVELSGSLHTPGAFFGASSERVLLTVER